MAAAIEIPADLLGLRAERALASIEGHAVWSVYLAGLEGEIEAAARAYVEAAVTEIASLRAGCRGRGWAEEMATMAVLATIYIGEPDHKERI
jgi:hypothetical protein